MQRAQYFQLDVFTDRAGGGNPLETTFVLAPELAPDAPVDDRGGQYFGAVTAGGTVPKPGSLRVLG